MSTTASPQPLTDRQTQVLEWISDHISRLGYSPTVREVGHAHGCTPNAVTGHLRALRVKGCITWDAGQARSIRLTGGAG